MGRCALILRQGHGHWSLKRQYDKMAGYCHFMRLEIAKIYIDPQTIAAETLQHDARDHGFNKIIVADGSVLDGLVASRPSLEKQLQEAGIRLLVVSEWEKELRLRAGRQVEAS